MIQEAFYLDDLHNKQRVINPRFTHLDKGQRCVIIHFVR